MKTKALFCMLMLVATLGLLSQGMSGKAPSTNYYVSPSGSNTNNGLSVNTPFKTIQMACDTVKAGDTVNIMAGTYNEAIEMSKSGSLTSGYITIQNYNSQRAIIDGTGLGSVSLLHMSNTKYIKINGLEFCNSLGDWAAGIYMEGHGDHIQIVHNKIYNINCADPLKAGSNPIIAAGTNGSTAISNLIIDGNQVYNCTVGWCEGISLDGNVSQWQITNNTIHDIGNIGIDVQGHWKTCPTDANDQARNGYIACNTIYKCNSPNEDGAAAGLYADGAANVIIEKNTVYNTQHGLEVGCEKNGYTADKITVRDNLIYNNTKGGIYFGGWSISEAGSITNSTLTNNTCYNNDTQSTEAGELCLGKVNNVTIKNNIFYSSTQNVLLTNEFSSKYTQNVTMNYNNWYAPGGNSSARFIWLDTEHSGLDSYKSASGNDMNSIFDNPLFISTSIPNLHIQSSSPSKNAGDHLFVAAEKETDYDGNARISNKRIDCGAFELQ